MLKLNFRQVHLDFHTSPDIEGVGACFDPEQFADTLVKARVNSITCFAKCHHGMIYFDSKTFPEQVHPHLVRKNLLGEQIEACHKRGIRVPIYISVQWDHYMASEHPDWLVITEDGAIKGTKPYEDGFYRYLCVNSPYRDTLKKLTEEILETFPVDGLFYDIVMPVDCSCKYCRNDMLAQGLDPSRKEIRLKYAQQMINNFKLEISAFVRKYNSECSIFYNKGHIGPAHRPVLNAYTHFEMESLPSGGWGYMHFPLTARYARNLGLDCLSQTGKFHTSWGDFHSFKNKEALEYECFKMLALNVKCMIGDQLEPCGRLSEPVYELIGSVYSQVEKKEPWCRNAEAVTDIGVFTPEEFYGDEIKVRDELAGAVRMLTESGHQFDIIDSSFDFSKYKVLIMPDTIPVNEELANKLDKYLNNGGALIASFESGMNEKKDEFVFKALGVKMKHEITRAPDGTPVRGIKWPRNAYADYILPKGPLCKGLPETEHVMYMKGVEVEAEPESEVLAEAVLPYFNRSYLHFCSHRQAPSSGKTGYAGVVKNGSVIYFAHPIFKQYNQNAPRWCKIIFLNALDLLLPQPLVRHEGPTTLQVELNEQKHEKRWILHLLHYIPERRCRDIDVIEDVIPLYNIKISVKTPCRVEKVVCQPEGIALDFEVKDGRVVFTVPEIKGHQMVAIEF